MMARVENAAIKVLAFLFFFLAALDGQLVLTGAYLNVRRAKAPGDHRQVVEIHICRVQTFQAGLHGPPP